MTIHVSVIPPRDQIAEMDRNADQAPAECGDCEAKDFAGCLRTYQFGACKAHLLPTTVD